MELLIERAYKKADYTIGRFFIDGERICETIEDKDRGLTQDMKEDDIRRRKVYGQTAIPTGRYVVGFTYSPKFSQCSYAKGGGKIPLVYGVKGFNSIRFHAGNSERDSEGCVILGENKVKGQVINSRATCEKVFARMYEAYLRNEPIFLTIR